MTPRTPKNKQLPKYVYISKGRYVYRPYYSKTKTKGREIPLCSVTKPIAFVWKQYLNITEKPQGESLNVLFNKFLKSIEFNDLSPRTKKEYMTYAENICQFPLKSGSTLGQVPYKSITSKIGLSYKKIRYKQARRRGEMELSFFKRVFNWAVENEEIIDNPLRSVSINKKSGSKQNTPPTDEQFEFVYERARSVIQAAMMIALCTRSRKSEVLQLTRDQLTHIGLDTNRLKGTRDSIIEWSNALHNTCNWDKGKHRFVQHIVHNRFGESYTVGGFNTEWQKLMEQVVKDKGKPFTFHSIKHKSITDDQGNKQDGSGLTPQMVRLYDHSKPIVESVK